MSKNQITKVVYLSEFDNTCLVSVPVLVSKIVVNTSDIEDIHPFWNISPFIMCRTDLIDNNDEIPMGYNGQFAIFSNNIPNEITYFFPQTVSINKVYTFNFYNAFDTSINVNTFIRKTILFTFYE